MSIIFVEGTSGLGKTTHCDQSFDFSKYLVSFPKFFEKHETHHIQTIYDNHIILDLMSYLLNLNNNVSIDETKNLYLDRCFISQFVYSILFKYKGQYHDPKYFADQLNSNVFSDKKLMDILKYGVEKLLCVTKKITNRQVDIYWCISNNPEFTANIIQKRKGFEVSSEKKTQMWNIYNYIRNQNFIFEKIHEILQIGSLIKVDEFLKF